MSRKSYTVKINLWVFKIIKFQSIKMKHVVTITPTKETYSGNYVKGGPKWFENLFFFNRLKIKISNPNLFSKQVLT